MKTHTDAHTHHKHMFHSFSFLITLHFLISPTLPIPLPLRFLFPSFSQGSSSSLLMKFAFFSLPNNRWLSLWEVEGIDEGGRSENVKLSEKEKEWNMCLWCVCICVSLHLRVWLPFSQIFVRFLHLHLWKEKLLKKMTSLLSPTPTSNLLSLSSNFLLLIFSYTHTYPFHPISMTFSLSLSIWPHVAHVLTSRKASFLSPLSLSPLQQTLPSTPSSWPSKGARDEWFYICTIW